jgi:hypothetical protein
VDSLRKHQKEAVRRRPWEKFGVEKGRYALLTLHRPSNVDTEERLEALVRMAGRIAERVPLLSGASAHARKDGQHASRAARLMPVARTVALHHVPGLDGSGAGGADGLGWNSGGQVPCLTLRTSTERPSTVEMGTNELVADDLTVPTGWWNRSLEEYGNRHGAATLGRTRRRAHSLWHRDVPRATGRTRISRCVKGDLPRRWTGEGHGFFFPFNNPWKSPTAFSALVPLVPPSLFNSSEAMLFSCPEAMLFMSGLKDGFDEVP